MNACAAVLLGFVLALVGAAPARALDDAPWARVLAAHVHDGRVDYGGLARDAAARRDLDRFVASLADMPASAPLADWLDAYNALVVHSVVARHPIASVRDVPGFFDRVRHRVANAERTLDAIENDVIRARFQDARVHVALNCGAVSCPPLPARPFAPATLDATLDRLARSFVASDAHVRVEGSRLVVSEIFFWFESDFRRDAGSVLAWLRRYDEHGRLAAVPDGATIERSPYRWALNDHAPRSRPSR